MAQSNLTGTGPLVSVCIPCYNCEKFLTQTVESVLGQTYHNIEVIIVDDGSLDGSVAILESFTDNRIKIFYQKNSGAGAARNMAYSKSAGALIKFLDADDIISPAMIESQVALALDNPGCIISAKWGRFYNNDLTTFSLSPENCWQTLPADEWLCLSWINGGSMTQCGIFLIPKAVLAKAGGWDEKLTLIDDLDFFTRVILKSDKVVFDPGSILYYRSGNSSSLSGSNGHKAVVSAFTSISQATNNFLAAYSSPQVSLACANILQHFIYDNYPKYPDLTGAAQKKIRQLGGSTLKYPCGGLTKKMVVILGWRAVSRLKKLFNQ